MSRLRGAEYCSSVGVVLRELRHRADLTGATMARRAGWSQPKISRIETGAVLPSEQDLRTWIAVTGANSERFEELWCLCNEARAPMASAVVRETSYVPSTSSLVERYEQRVRLDLERGGFRAWFPGHIGPILVTRTFLRETLEGVPDQVVRPETDSQADPLELVSNLRVRHQDMLYRSQTSVQIVLGESALYCCPGSVETMVSQLDRLLDLLVLPGLDLRVLPFHDRHSSAMSTPFVLYDDDVLIPLLASDVWSDDAGEVGVYRTLFDELSERARVGDDVRAVIERARSWHTSQPDSDLRPVATVGDHERVQRHQ